MFLRLCLFALLAAPLAAAPNILVPLAADSVEGDRSILGRPTLRTQSIDRIGREGTDLSNAFLTPSPCSASRASILTGRSPRQTGPEDSHLPLPPEQHTLARHRGWTRDGIPLPHNQLWYDRYIQHGGRHNFEKL